MKMQIANAIFQNLFQIWIDSKTKKERLIFFPYQLGLLSFFQNMSSFMEVLWIKNLAKGIKQKAWNRKQWSSKDLKGVRVKAKRKRNLKENS